MRKVTGSILFAAFSSTALIPNTGWATFLPANNLNLEDSYSAANMTELQFNQTIDNVALFYAPIIKAHGATLKMVKAWTDSTVNAYAQQIGTSWQVNMFGGLARRPEVTLDGFALVVCHELGHHLGGFPYASSWAANEGQADYFATLACGKNLWSEKLEENATYRKTVDPVAKKYCDTVNAGVEEQDLCYRQMAAGMSLGKLLGVLGGTPNINYGTPDASKVTKTNNAHPAAQCRLDTYMAGALCLSTWDDALIPKTELISSKVTCTAANEFEDGLRPLCWYKPTMQDLDYLAFI